MTTVDDTAIAIADEYAEAVLRLVEERGVTDEFMSELGDFVGYIESETAFGDFLDSPIVDTESRRDLLERTLRDKMSDILLDTILVLNSKGRAGLIPLLHKRLQVALDKRRNEVEVLVTTAHPLTEELRERLIRVLADRTGCKPRLVEQVTPSIIAGVKVQIGDEVLDLSASNHLRRMREALVERASHELHTAEQPFVAD
ncbi:MAG: ATP synthase F1 subunit delta [Phycisphaerae bacterium]|nr:ATP synthase F1 subunit delta [Phycisphaerae bacterium]